MLRVFLFICFIAFASSSVVFFEAYTNQFCTFSMWNDRTFVPVTDRVQGIDSQVSLNIYSGNPPATTGTWSVLNETTATLCNFGTCTSWPVYSPKNTSQCDFVPCFGYGRFYTEPGPVSLELWRTTGQGTTEDCRADQHQWVAYGTQISDASAACATSGYQVFWDGGSKLSYFYPGVAPWTKTQPCGTAPFPGEKCASSGQLYCAVSADCSIDRANSPTRFPWFGFYSTTVKAVSANRVGTPASSTTGPGSSAMWLSPSLLLLLFVFFA